MFFKNRSTIMCNIKNQVVTCEYNFLPPISSLQFPPIHSICSEMMSPVIITSHLLKSNFYLRISLLS